MAIGSLVVVVVLLKCHHCSCIGSCLADAVGRCWRQSVQPLNQVSRRTHCIVTVVVVVEGSFVGLHLIDLGQIVVVGSLECYFDHWTMQMMIQRATNTERSTAMQMRISCHLGWLCLSWLMGL